MIEIRRRTVLGDVGDPFPFVDGVVGGRQAMIFGEKELLSSASNGVVGSVGS